MRGSHRYPSDDLSPAMTGSILKQAGLRKDQ